MANLETKAALRERICTALARISPAVRMAESIDLCSRLEPQLRSARSILFFAPMPDELDIWPLLEKFLASPKNCALPAFDPVSQTYGARRVMNLETDIAPGKFGVREPMPGCPLMPMESFDLVLVPGLAFDLSGSRLGRGRGFYDRILASASGVKCGVGYDFQLLEAIPTEAHDARVNFIFTPTQCRRRLPAAV
jgi:5-formyltetrahydrofolate cyclo-ligase